MAITSTSTDKSRTEYRTDLQDDTTKTSVSIVSQADGKRITGITVYVVKGEDDNNNFNSNTKKAVHDAVVAAVQARIGNGI